MAEGETCCKREGGEVGMHSYAAMLKKANATKKIIESTGVCLIKP